MVYIKRYVVGGLRLVKSSSICIGPQMIMKSCNRLMFQSGFENGPNRDALDAKLRTIIVSQRALSSTISFYKYKMTKKPSTPKKETEPQNVVAKSVITNGCVSSIRLTIRTRRRR